MKVLILVQWPIPHQGGVSTHVETLISSLRIHGHETRLVHGGLVCISKLTRAFQLMLSMGNRDRYHVRQRKAVLQMLRDMIMKEVESFQPDIIHCHDPFTAMIATSMLAGIVLPVIETVHGPAFLEARVNGFGPRMCDYIKYCEQVAFSKVSRIISVDKGQFDILVKDYKIQDERIDIIQNAVDCKAVCEQAAGEPLIEVPSPYFLVPRRLVEKNGVRYAIEAFSLLDSRDVYLVIAGPGHLRQELEGLAKEKGVEQRTVFLGGVTRAQLLPLYKRALSVLIPSIPVNGVVEATSLSALEAMVLGVPPIASNIGGLSELIRDQETGLLVPPAESCALSEAMKLIMNDSNLRTKIASNAKKMVETNFSEDKWITKILNVYQMVTI